MKTTKAQRIDAHVLERRAAAIRKQELAELRRLTSLESVKRDIIRIVQDTAPVLGVPKLRTPLPLGHKPVHTWAPVLSDWQLGQKDTFASTGGMFEQSTDVVKAQVHEFDKVVGRLHDIYRDSLAIEEFVIFSLGDLLDGDQLRPSQAANVDALVTRQVVDVTDLLSWLTTQALGRFPKVRLLHVGGNHERTSPKAGNAGLGELGFTDTYSWIIGEFLKRQHARAIDSSRLQIENFDSFFGTATVAGLRCVFEHGASFKASVGSYGGIGYYPIANAATRYQSMLGGADMVLMGHHHTGMVLPLGGGWGWQVMNGALPPSSGFGQSVFKSVRRPLQFMLNLNEKHGLVAAHPIYLETPGLVRPGQFWAGQRKRSTRRRR